MQEVQVTVLWWEHAPQSFLITFFLFSCAWRSKKRLVMQWSPVCLSVCPQIYSPPFLLWKKKWQHMQFWAIYVSPPPPQIMHNLSFCKNLCIPGCFMQKATEPERIFFLKKLNCISCFQDIMLQVDGNSEIKDENLFCEAVQNVSSRSQLKPSVWRKTSIRNWFEYEPRFATFWSELFLTAADGNGSGGKGDLPRWSQQLRLSTPA